jgi:anti-sigma regulatory factor (Ser/Thr protein kinase)
MVHGRRRIDLRAGAPVGHGSLHEAALYGSDEECLAVVVPFLHDGVEAGEPTLIGSSESTSALLWAAAEVPGVVLLDDADGSRARPASLIKANRKTFSAAVADGARRIRFIGEVPHSALVAQWKQWARYEAALNHAYAMFPVWNICAYDTRAAPDSVIADVLHTHPHLVTADGHHEPNPHYEDPAEFLARDASYEPDPLEVTSAPVVDIADPTPRVARDAVRAVRSTTRLTSEEVDDLVFAVNEAVTNALVHGRPPVRFRLWSASQRVVATVSDTGGGPTDPFAGLLPTARTAPGGMGLWAIHQICSDVRLHRGEHGFTIRLVAAPAVGAG